MLTRGKSDICVKFSYRFNPFRNVHNRPHTSFPQLIYLTGLPSYLGDNHHFVGCSHHDDDDVEVIYSHEYRHHVGTGNDEVKRENSKPEPVSTTPGLYSLISLIIYFEQDGL